MHFRIQIKNATIVNEGRKFLGTLVIDDDRIEEILEGMDATPLYLLTKPLTVRTVTSCPVSLTTTFTFATQV